MSLKAKVQWPTVAGFQIYGIFRFFKKQPEAPGGAAETNLRASQSVSGVHQRLLLGKVTKVAARMWLETPATVHPFYSPGSILEKQQQQQQQQLLLSAAALVVWRSSFFQL